MEKDYDLTKLFEFMDENYNALLKLTKELQDSIKEHPDTDDTLCPYCGQKLPEK